MRPRPLLLAAALLAAAACASVPPAVPVQASPADLSRLAGEWIGSYEGRETGRSGSIEFRLEAGRDTAHGDVVMVPSGSTRPLVRRSPASEPGAAAAEPTLGRMLTIRFVHVEGGWVSGTLEPYADPECGCELVTVFQGVVAGDRIRGEFRTSGAPGQPRTGRWEVRRRG